MYQIEWIEYDNGNERTLCKTFNTKPKAEAFMEALKYIRVFNTMMHGVKDIHIYKIDKELVI